MPKTVRPTPTPDPITQAQFVPCDDGTLFSAGQDLETVDECVKAVGVDPSSPRKPVTYPGHNVSSRTYSVVRDA
jgi:hypothetical protein